MGKGSINTNERGQTAVPAAIAPEVYDAARKREAD